MNSHRVIAFALSICWFLISGGTVLADTYPSYASHVTRDSIEIVAAYIDPGAAGFVITTVLGFIAAVGYTIRLYFHRLKSIFSPGNRSSNETEEASARRDGEDGARS